MDRSEPPIRTYRSRTIALVNGLIAGVLLPSLMVLTILGQPLSPAATPTDRVVAILGCVACGLFVLLRVVPARLCVYSDGVKAINPFRRRFVPWTEIAGFSLRPWNIFWTPVGHIDRIDGSSVPILGIGRSHETFFKRRTSADEMIEELNELLQARQRSPK